MGPHTHPRCSRTPGDPAMPTGPAMPVRVAPVPAGGGINLIRNLFVASALARKCSQARQCQLPATGSGPAQSMVTHILLLPGPMGHFCIFGRGLILPPSAKLRYSFFQCVRCARSPRPPPISRLKRILSRRPAENIKSRALLPSFSTLKSGVRRAGVVNNKALQKLYLSFAEGC